MVVSIWPDNKTIVIVKTRHCLSFCDFDIDKFEVIDFYVGF